MYLYYYNKALKIQKEIIIDENKNKKKSDNEKSDKKQIKEEKEQKNEIKEREQNEELLIDVLENTCSRLQASGKI